MANNNDKFISRENAKTLWGYMIDLLTGKQNKLTFDETPTQSSDNPVKSGGIFTALAGKGTYSKPQNGIPKTDLESTVQTSLGLADSALQSETDPTVPSWAKQTNKPSYTQDEVGDGTTYKRVNQTEKDTWSGKQNALSITQMQAVNSGITSAGVAQIGINQANILYNLNTGVKNELDNFGTTSYESSGVTFTFNEDGSVHIKGTATGGNAAFYYYTGRYLYISNIYKGHILSGVTGGAEGTYGLLAQYSSNGTSWATQEMCKTAPITIKSDYNYINICIIVFSGQTVDTTIYPMLCTPEAWAQSTDYQPPAKSNSTLTRLESEDRAALAERIDAGAKNILDEWNEVAKRYGATGNTIGRNGITYTYSNGSITISGTATANENFFLLQDTMLLSNGNYVVSWRSKTINAIVINVKYLNMATTITSSDGVIELPNRTDSSSLWLTIPNGTTVSGTIDIMICTLADWKASQKYVPYKTDFITESLKPWEILKSGDNLDNLVSAMERKGVYFMFAVGTTDVLNKPANGIIAVRTTNYGGGTALQEVTMLTGNDRGKSYVRTFINSSDWSAWKETTNT